MPGKILQNMSRVGVRNPLFLLDEVDKMGADFRGDPSCCCWKCWIREQNASFVDHYIEVEYDLSDDVCRDSQLAQYSCPLLDRMEIIRPSGYTEDESQYRRAISDPLQIKANGPERRRIAWLPNPPLRDIVHYYPGSPPGHGGSRLPGLLGRVNLLLKRDKAVAKGVSESARNRTSIWGSQIYLRHR